MNIANIYDYVPPQECRELINKRLPITGSGNKMMETVYMKYIQN